MSENDHQSRSKIQPQGRQMNRRWSEPIEEIWASHQIRTTREGVMATTSYTVKRSDGQVDLVAIVHQAMPNNPEEASDLLERQSKALKETLMDSGEALYLKDVHRTLSQDEISRLAISAMRKIDAGRGQDERYPGESVLMETAIFWRLLKQFGSSKPAEVLGEYFNAKPKTINARLAAARAKKLIPQISRKNVSKDHSTKNEKD